MGCILITGMSGVGKTAVLRGLRTRGFFCIDMDEEGWSFMDVHGHQRWNIAQLQDALEKFKHDSLFVFGCSQDQSLFHGKFQAVILLSAPKQVMMDRIRNRMDHSFGKAPGEMDRILRDLEEIEPLLRKRCTHEIVTTVPLPRIMDRILEISRTAG